MSSPVPPQSGLPLDDAKDRVRQAVDIVELVGRQIQLRRQGRNYVGLCPWHDDSRPSLQVNPERQSFKCWVCDIGGDVFSWVMKNEGVEFREALEMLAEQAGIEIRPAPRPAQGASPGTPGGPPDKRTLYQAMAWVEQQYHDCLLNASEAEPARAYLEQRGITPESVEKFHLGFCPNERDWTLRKVQGSAERSRVLETIGVVARPQDGGSYYDRFRGRVLFAIRDAQGRPVGLGGRVLPESGLTSPAKYVNSPETPLFSKSHLLYALDVAKDAIRQKDPSSGIRTALVMEGYTDVIVAHQFGFENAVAVLGTALGEGHIRILKRFADRIILVLDGDEAGQRRANEVLGLFVAQQVDLGILTLPEGSDPCEFLLNNGAEAFRELIEKRTVDALDHAFRVATRDVNLETDIHGSTQALERLIEIVARAPRLRADTTGEDRFREERILQRLAAWFRIDEQEVRRRLTDLRRRSHTRAPSYASETDDERPAMKIPPLDPAYRELLEVLLLHPEALGIVREELHPSQLWHPTCRLLYETSCRLADEGILPEFDRLMLEFDEPAIKSLLVELDEGAQAKGHQQADPEPLLRELIRVLKHKESEKQRPGQITALRQGELDESQQARLLEELIRQERNRQGISEPTDG